MDSLTHIALGACIGEAFFEKGFGKKAMFWGALAQSVPDIDFIAGTWMNTPDALLAHRGFTHSIVFVILMTPILSMTADRIHRPHNIAFRNWIAFFAIEMFVHLFIDVYNNYGVAWLEPFSHHRFSLNAIYVADPLFSIWPGIAFLFLLLLNKYHTRRTFWWRFGVILPVFYLAYCTYNKFTIDRDVKQILGKQDISYSRYFTTPAPLQNWLWYVVAGNDSGYYVGYRSVFDSRKEIQFNYFPRNDSLLRPVSDHEEVQKLVRFSQQFYTVEKWQDTIVFNDLRFGQIIGWDDPKGKFVFHYFLEHPRDNKLVVQRGRFSGWTWATFNHLWTRIRGN
jgi:inner membrane protein